MKLLKGSSKSNNFSGIRNNIQLILLVIKVSCPKSQEGMVYYQVSYKRTMKQICTGYKLYLHEWDKRSSEIVFSSFSEERNAYLQVLQTKISNDKRILKRIIAVWEKRGASYTAKEVVQAFMRYQEGSLLLSSFMEKVMEQLRRAGKVRTSETYRSTLNSFMRFRKDEEVLLEEIDSDLMMDYETWLKSNGISMNTVSFYMRILRATYNRAVENNLIAQQYPFKHVYTGIAKTVKRAIPFRLIKRLKSMDLSSNKMYSFARDMFLFSFYTRGMAFVDMAFLRKKDLNKGTLSYRRKKTGQLLFIKWEPCMQEIVDRYFDAESPYLLPLIKKAGVKERNQYINGMHQINKYLGKIGEDMNIPVPLTLYVARHTWASVAKSKNIPLSVICEGMGHDSETTTRIYLTSLDTTPVDRANHLILNSL